VQRVRGGAGRDVGEHRQDVRFAVPEAVPVIARAGQALRRDGPAFSAGAGLQHVKQREAHRLLDLGVPVELHVGAGPERVQVGPLRGQQPVPAGLPGPGKRGVGLIADRGQRPGPRPAVGDELDQPQPLAGLERRHHRRPGQVRETFGQHLGTGRPVDDMVHDGGDPQAAAPGRVHQPGAGALRRVLLGGQRRLDHRRGPWVITGRRQLLVRDQFGLHHHPHGAIQRFYLIADRRDRPLHERHQPLRRHPDRAAGRGGPVGPPPQHACTEIEHLLVRAQLPVADIKRFVVHQQADQLAVGDVDHRLPGLRAAVAGLRIGDGP